MPYIDTGEKTGLSRFDKILIGAVIAVIICIVLMFVYANGSKGRESGSNADSDNATASSSQQKDETARTDTAAAKPVTSFAECKKATGSKLLQTSPVQCVTKDGKKFTDKTTAINGNFESAGNMAIDTWGVQMPIPRSTPGLSYEINASDEMTLFVRSLETNSCQGAVGKIERAKAGSGDSNAVAGYSYKFVAPAQPCSTDETMKTTETQARSDFAQAAKLITAKE